MYVLEDKCKEFGIDVKKVESIARRLSKAAKEAHDLGLVIFGGSGRGTLRFSDSQVQGPDHNEVALLDGNFDGGDGGDVYS